MEEQETAAPAMEETSPAPAPAEAEETSAAPEVKAEKKRPWLLTDAGITYVMVFISGGLLIGGSLLPWVSFSSLSGLDEELRELGGLTIDTSTSQTTAIGSWGFGFGIITFIIGLMAIGGLVKTPFGIAQKLYMKILGLAAVLVMVAFIIDFNDSSQPFQIGLWLTLAGAGVLTLWSFGSSLKEFNFNDPSNRVSVCNTLNIGGILIPALVSAFTLPYISERIAFNFLTSFGGLLRIARSIDDSSLDEPLEELGASPTLLHPDLRGHGIIIIVLLFTLLLLCVMSKSKYKPSAGMFLLLSFPLLALSSVFLFRIFIETGSYATSGGGAAAWVILVCSALISIISYRSIRSGRASAI